jgi:Rrf2 family protein
MLLSRKCVYGLRAILYVARKGSDTYVPISEISKKLKISFHFLTKILQILTRHKIMKSYRGPNGGVTLARPAGKITILKIIRLIDGDHTFQQCVLGLPHCSDKNPCPLHHKWADVSRTLQNVFDDMTVKDLAVNIKELNLRLTDG